MKIAIDYDDTIAHGWPSRIDQPYAIEVIKRWQSLGHECFILTGRHEKMHILEAEEELKFYQLQIPVISIGSYDMGLKLKHQWDVLIDDSDELLWEHTTSNDIRPLVTMHTYANADMEARYRAHSWYDVERIVDSLIKGT